MGVKVGPTELREGERGPRSRHYEASGRGG